MRTNTKESWRALVLESIRAIFLGLDEPLSARRLAENACFSTFHFHRMFCAMTGESASEMARRLRLERAAHRLHSTAASVTEVAFDAGFETLEAFSRAFRTEFGQSPSAYRRLKGTDARIPAPNTVHWTPSGAPFAFDRIAYKGETMDIKVKEIEEIRLACIRHVGPYNQIGKAFESLNRLVESHAFAKPGARWIAIYRDNPDIVPAEELRSEACVEIESGAVLPPGVEEAVIPGGKYAVAVHKGAYEGLGQAWGTFCGKLIPEAGLQFREGVCFEAYIHDGEGVPESEQLTELYEPVA